MSSQIADIAEAVKDAINAAGTDLSETVTALRVYVPAFDLKDIGELSVRVVPRSYERTNVSRAATAREVPIDIGIAKRVSETCDPETEAGNDELDPLMQFAEEVADLFGKGEIGSTGARWIRTEIPDPIYDVTDLREKRTFKCVVRVTFRIP